jgi:hypothetical protein
LQFLTDIKLAVIIVEINQSEAIAVYLLWIGGMLCEIVSGVGELIFGDNGSIVIWLIIIIGGAAWLFL